MITGKPFKFFWAKIREYNLKEIHEFLHSPIAPIQFVSQVLSTTRDCRLHGSYSNTILAWTPQGDFHYFPQQLGPFLQQCPFQQLRAFLQQLQTFKQMGTRVQ